MVPEPEIPQSLKDQADAQIKALGGATAEESEAEMVKARTGGRPCLKWFLEIINLHAQNYTK